jgi:hypothetical protein
MNINMDNSVTIMFAILLVFIIYLQIQINKLSSNNQENFDTPDPNTVAIANLNNLANSILNKNALTISTDTTISGQINVPYDMSLVAGNDKWLRVYSTTTKNYDAGFAAKNLWCGDGTLTAKGVSIISTDNPLIMGSKNKWLFNTFDDTETLIIRRANGDWSEPLFILDKNGNLNVKGSISCNGTITATGNINTASDLIAAGGVSTGTNDAKYTLWGGGDGFRISTGGANDTQRHWFRKNPGQKNW